MAGICKICGAPGSFGFQPPGLRKDRIAHWIAWGCYEHRAEVKRMWQAHRDAYRVDRAAGATQAEEHLSARSGGVLGYTQDTKQGALDL